jgi:hypothetical protein
LAVHRRRVNSDDATDSGAISVRVGNGAEG